VGGPSEDANQPASRSPSPDGGSGSSNNGNDGNDSDDGDDGDSDDQDSWIEDDGDGVSAGAVILPEGYSMRGHQSLAHHLKVVMQMFVHLACLKTKKRQGFRDDERNGGYMHSLGAWISLTSDGPLMQISTSGCR
jgi:hypothetical protein